ncbi:MAG: CHAT domain-containing protein [Planctomycetota bacterium]
MRDIVRKCTWQAILACNLSAFSNLANGEFQALMAEGRIHEARQHSIARYKEALNAIDSDTELSELFLDTLDSVLIAQQTAVHNWPFCYEHARKMQNRGQSWRTLYNACLIQILGMRALLKEVRQHPAFVTDAEVGEAEDTLLAVLRHEYPLLTEALNSHEVEAARTLPGYAGVVLAEHFAWHGNFDRCFQILDEIKELPTEFRREPESLQKLQTLFHILKANGSDPLLRDRARDLYKVEFQEALENDDAIPFSESGSTLLADDRLGGVVDTHLIIEWPGTQGGAIEKSAFDWLLATQDSGTLARAMNARSKTFAQLCISLLPSDEAILYLHAGRFHSTAILVAPHQVRMFRLCRAGAAKERFENLSQSFLAWHHNPSKQPPDWQDASQSLTELLFPVELRAALEELDPSVLYLTGSLDDEYLPWEALPWSDELTFGERFALAYLPSMVVGVALAERAQTGPPVSPTLAQLLVTDEPLTGGRLDFDVDRKSLLEAYGNPGDTWDHVVFFGQEASAAALTAPHVPGAALIHVLTHGQEAKEGIPSQTLLMPNGAGGQTEWTYANFDTPLQGSTILLSACAPAAAVPRRGDDGRHHVPGAMLAAGAPTVICSTLPTRFRASQAIDREILAALADGQNPAQALRTMRRNLGEGFGPDRFLPQVIGVSKGRVPDRPRSKRASWSRVRPEKLAWFRIAKVGAVLGAAGLLLFLFRKRALRQG